MRSTLDLGVFDTLDGVDGEEFAVPQNGDQVDASSQQAADGQGLKADGYDYGDEVLQEPLGEPCAKDIPEVQAVVPVPEDVEAPLAPEPVGEPQQHEIPLAPEPASMPMDQEPAPVIDAPEREAGKRLEEKKAIHRENSAAWHKQLIKKGVPRNSVDGDNTSEPSQPIQSLSQARDQFVAKWIQDSNMPKSMERRTAAYEAWMSSETRANILAGRSGVQK